MYGEKRAKQIEYKARKQRESLAGVSNTAPLNVQVRLRAYCMIWELKQKYYKADTPLPYVSKASHKADEERIKSLEATLENEDVIEGIRAYIASRNDYLIVELVDGKEPADPEGTVFECKTALYQLYPAIYKGVSTAEGKTFSFSRGEKQNRYITNDAEEIKILRDYIKTRVDNMFTEVRE